MAHTITFSKITDEDKERIGVRGYDLSRMAQAGYPVPLSFIIKTTLFESFLDSTGLRGKIAAIYDKHPQTIDGYARAYKELRELFAPIKFSPQLKEELLEAYQSLAITDKDDLVGGSEEPLVMLVPSLTYRLKPERLMGVQRCIKGAERFYDAIKECWLSAYMPEAVMERQHYQQSTFSTAVIVEQQIMGDGSAEASFEQGAEFPLIVRSYHGLIDTEGEILKDEYLLQTDPLGVVRSKNNRQPFKLVPGEASSVVTQVGMGEQGGRPALTDKQALEAARVAKRAHVILQTDLSAYFSIKDDKSTLLLLLRRSGKPLTQVIDESEEPEPVKEEGNGYISLEEVPGQRQEVEVVDEEELQEEFVETYDVSHGSQLIIEAMDRLHEAIERRYQELHGQSASFAAMVESLHEAGELPVDRDDLNLLVRGKLFVDSGEEPHDHLIGVAWRVHRGLR